MLYLERFALNLWSILIETSPWLLMGLVLSGFLKVWMPTHLLHRWLGGRGILPIFKAAIIGTPLPLCSCSVIPAAVTLRRAGASKGATVSFLIATPENGADSITLTYALLGPFMTLLRPVSAIISAVAGGLLTSVTSHESFSPQNPPPTPTTTGCCCETSQPAAASKVGVSQKIKQALGYAGDDLFKDIAFWLGIGLVLAALINTFVPPDTMTNWGSGLPAMLAILCIGVPMYICATASTPVAAAMLLSGVSPGTVLVFLLAGPATNLGTLGIVKRELGGRACMAYLISICSSAILFGLGTNWIVRHYHIAVQAQVAKERELLPLWLSLGCLTILSGMVVRLLWTRQKARHLASHPHCC